ncbi:hypothetical protein M427DRAFT_57352 [Gonapodya prolifera JEL478]|uniref:Zn(2)-C6 fungal-type domain-containing protein n=1 Tax=Gonapodya prolifera (strain JEL478) TaxID=1344416 RepID=A0A139AD00_GONPJ|nr:hypothetical protein M427DRAFT_57352 [Gonapodya prolifera JEL478]|eukprot:KXS14692.1 hypothetical protein M427DRAFT_57352 [Gonapodya prolifera JEL478]
MSRAPSSRRAKAARKRRACDACFFAHEKCDLHERPCPSCFSRNLPCTDLRDAHTDTIKAQRDPLTASLNVNANAPIGTSKEVVVWHTHHRPHIDIPLWIFDDLAPLDDNLNGRLWQKVNELRNIGFHKNELAHWELGVNVNASKGRGPKNACPLIVYANMAFASLCGVIGIPEPKPSGDARDALPYLERCRRLMGYVRNVPSPDGLAALLNVLIASIACFYISSSAIVKTSDMIDDVVSQLHLDRDPQLLDPSDDMSEGDLFIRRMLFWVPLRMRWGVFYLTANSRVQSVMSHFVVDAAQMYPYMPSVLIPADLHDVSSPTLQPSSFLSLSPAVLEHATKGFIGEDVDPAPLSTYGYFLCGQVGAYRTWLSGIASKAPEEPFLLSPNSDSFALQRLRNLDECFTALYKLLPQSSIDLLQTGKGYITFSDMDAWFVPGRKSFLASQIPRPRFCPNACFWLFDMLGARIMLHSPVEGNAVLLSEVTGSCQSSGDQTEMAWLQHDLGFAKCMEAASRITCLLQAYALSCWSERVTAVFPMAVFGIYLCVVMNIINYRNLQYLSSLENNGELSSQEIDLNSSRSSQAENSTVSSARDIALFSLSLLEAVGSILHSAREFALVARYTLTATSGPFVPTHRLFDYDELRKLSGIVQTLRNPSGEIWQLFVH